MTQQAESLASAVRDAALRMAEAAGPAAAREALLKTAEDLLIDCLKWEPHPENERAVRVSHYAGYGRQLHAEVEYEPEIGTYRYRVLHEGRPVESSGDYESPEQAKQEAIEALMQMF